jgi:hypothetical protein
VGTKVVVETGEAGHNEGYMVVWIEIGRFKTLFPHHFVTAP